MAKNRVEWEELVQGFQQAKEKAKARREARKESGKPSLLRKKKVNPPRKRTRECEKEQWELGEVPASHQPDWIGWPSSGGSSWSHAVINIYLVSSKIKVAVGLPLCGADELDSAFK